jgi:septal ring factor EnvC (AmiA/AmiB activator)
MNSPTKRIRRYPMTVVVTVAALSCLSGAVDDPEARLQSVTARIQEIQADIEAETGRRDSETVRLRQAEREASEAARALRATKTSLKESRARQAVLQQQVDAGTRKLGAKRHSLATQVKAVYAGGQTERLRLLLNQQEPGRVGRILMYYRYLTDDRAQEINAVLAEINELTESEARLAENSARLTELAARQTEEARLLDAARQERSRAVASLDARIKDRRSEAARLTAEAATLQSLIEELRRALIDLPGTDRDSFSTRKGKLDWPTSGILISDFGQPRAGGSLKWNGVVIGTDRGRDVRAVYYGRVAYADWLPGMGLLLVIEHGDGYMSLYGHNESLYKRVGDWVEPGEVVAAAGDTGGKSRSGLYFEIRRNGEPENPHRWFGKRLAAK